MIFEWDEDKNTANIEQGRPSFDLAVRVFSDPDRITQPDTRHDYGEPRFVTAGRIEGRLFIVVHTPRGERTRIISARKANRREEARHG